MKSLLTVLLLSTSALAQAPQGKYQQLAHDIFKQLIEINTTDSVGNVTTAAEAVAARLKAAGFPDSDVQVLGPYPHKKNVVARLHGSGARKPLLLIAHLDVVEARKEDWSPDLDPFQFIERDGYFYGRGTSDIKDGDAILVTNFIRWKQEGFKPDRDLILALTADEEGGHLADANGIAWLLKNHRELIDAEYCVNLDGGDFQTQKGKRIVAAVQAAEKFYNDFTWKATNRGGHSSLPRPDNAIYDLSGALDRLAPFRFPLDLNEVTAGYLERSAALQQGDLAADMKAFAANPKDAGAEQRLSQFPFVNGLLRTTCVATMLNGGHAANALPQLAQANVNCRILPGEDPKKIEAQLRELAGPKVQVEPVGPAREPAPLSKLRPELMQAVEKISAQMFPAAIVIPTMEIGATDGAYLRGAGIPTYGISGIFGDVDDVRAHGRDERIGIKDFYDGLEFNDRLVKALAGKP